MLVERVRRIRGDGGALPDAGRDEPGVDLDALRVRRVDERLQRVERRRRDPGDRRAREARVVAEAVAAPDDLGHDRVHVGVLHVGHELVDLGLGVDAVAEGVDPERAQLAADRRGGEGAAVGHGRRATSGRRAGQGDKQDSHRPSEPHPHPFHHR